MELDPLTLGVLVALATILVLFSGISVAMGLIVVSVGFIWVFDWNGWFSVTLLPEILFGKLNNFALLSIPMFILMGAAVASSRAGSDLYEALERWLTRVPGGLVVSNLGACAIFSALSGSSPATCAAIGKMGIPEMRKRGYPDTVAAGSIAAGGTLGILIPPSVTMIVYGIATETSIGRLFLAGALPGLMLVGLFMAWSIYDTWRNGATEVLTPTVYSWAEKFSALPRVVPFIAIILGVLFALYGGVATPSETAAVGALLVIVVAVVVYRMWQAQALWVVLRDCTKESVMILLIIGASGLFSYMLSSLFITQSIAEWITQLDVNRWVLMLAINVFLLIAGFFLPPVAVILMAAPILLPIVAAAGFDPYWFAVVLTINMEIGLISPPVGLNLYVINGIAPDIKLQTILKGSLPYVGCMVVAILLLCVFPGIATWLPDLVMGPAIK
ncbi:TRAP transporter large permease [Algihabitans albus]|uniref:TRAP transporter large permease n=1 Tax=Algihabitans albus TaxID=2164067 RepID=UPI000E5D7C74|nr:TRAP transporter large permease [Algihabitans albus]